MISLDLENLYIWESSHIKTATQLMRDISNIFKEEMGHAIISKAYLDVEWHLKLYHFYYKDKSITRLYML